MALKSFDTWISSGIAVNLGTQDSAFVGAGGLVSSSDGTAILGVGSYQMVDVQGAVVGWQYGIHLGFGPPSTNEHVLIEEGGFVGDYGGLFSIYFNGSSSLVDNRGKVYSNHYGIVYDEGVIGTSSKLINSGTIEVDDVAVAHWGADSFVGTNSGIISAGSTAFDGNSQVDSITNTGTIIGTVTLDNGDDIYSGASGHLLGHLTGDAGADTAIGGTDNDWFEGGTENDTLKGNAGKDTIKGDAGSDHLFGGLGNDTLTGGAGKDFFVFNTAPNNATNKDTITDFSHVDDTFQLENAVFKALGANGALKPSFFFAGKAAHDADDHIIYNHATGALYYDSNGNAAGAAIQFAVLSNHPTLTAGDFVVI